MYKDIGKRIMALLLSVCMIAGMVDLSGFTVHAEEKTYTEIRAEVAPGAEFKYTGEAIELKPEDIVVTATVEDADGQTSDEVLTAEQYELQNYTNNMENQGK